MRALLLVCWTLCTALSAEPKKNSLEESLTLRRIAEYWKEKDFSAVKRQIQSFLSAYPDSAHADSLYAMLGDLLFNENNYKEAHRAYVQIKDPLFAKQTHYQHLYCLYEEGLFDQVIASATTFLEQGTASKEQEEAARFQLADSLFQLGNLTEHLEGKNHLFIQSVSHFKQLTSSSYANQTHYPLAIMYTHLKENDKAAALYEQLANRYPEQREAFLFQAATLYLPSNKNKATDLYGAIYPLNGKHASDAAFNHLQLLFAQKRYRELLTLQDKALQYVAIEHFPLIRYYIGKSLFAVGDPTHAATHLLQFVDGKGSHDHLIKNACLTLVQCAHKTRNLPLFNQSLQHLLRVSPQGNETMHVLLLHAQFCQEIGELTLASNDLKTLLEQHPHHIDRPHFLYDYGAIAAKQKNWDIATKTFQAWLTEFPKHPQKANVYRQLLVCQAELCRTAPPETALILKQDLIATLKTALAQIKLFSASEKKQLQYCLGKTLYDMRSYDEALDLLTQYVETYPQDPSVYLLMAYCHLQGAFDPTLFTLHAEKALALNADLPNRESLHLQLYNAYLLLAQQAIDADKTDLLSQAAHHLFCGLRQPMQTENRLWLAHYYIDLFERSNALEKDLYLSRAIAVLEYLMTTSPLDSPRMESEAIRLSQLYIQSNHFKSAITLLEKLQNAYEICPDVAWKYQRLSLFELAQAYEKARNLDMACATYEELITSSQHAYSYFGVASQLKKCRIAFEQLLPDEKVEGSEELQSLYDTLKNLQLQRRLASEPWHLEAAIAYIDMKVACAPEEQQQPLRLQLIEQAYDLFAAENDPLVKQYLLGKEQFPEQMKIYEQYMQFLSAEKLRLKGIAEGAKDRS